MTIKRKDIKVGDILVTDNAPVFNTIDVVKITPKYIEDTNGDRFLCNQLTKPTSELTYYLNELKPLQKTERELIDMIWAIIHPESIDK